MAIPLFGVTAHGGRILSLDDRAVVKDLANLDGTGGNTYAAYVVSTFLPGADESGYARFRRLTQRVPHDGAVRVEVTPWRDGADTGQTITRDLATGDNPTVVAPANVTGSVFQAKLRLSNFDAPARLGAGEYMVVPRRSVR